ncbi:MAG: hypothetical protein P8047_17435 [Gammaproteobacteria bacterium]
MPEFHGFQFKELIFENKTKSIYRAIRNSNNKSVIIKYIKNENHNPVDAELFENGYHIAKDLDLKSGDPKGYIADISLAHQWGWEPTIHWQEGVQEYAAWYRNSMP